MAIIPDLSKFCGECGARIGAPGSTQVFDRESLISNYIPPELAKRIMSVGKQLESERRLVTVVFTDISGFTAMSEKLDAEVVAAVLNDCFKGLISTIYKYEGVVDKFIGDNIMALFGAPIAHENDAERAVRCALEMKDFIIRYNQLRPSELPEPLDLHIAINTGMVVAGNVGSDLRMNYSVIGDTVNLASRLEHEAKKGEIVISDKTYGMISSLVNVAGPFTEQLKGISQPVKFYRVSSMKSDIEPGVRVIRDTPMVGRDHEAAILSDAIEDVLQKKEVRVYVRGEAGVGKTRLKIDLIKRALARGLSVFEGKCSSFELNTPYYLWTTLLRSMLKLDQDAGESDTRKRLHDTLQILSLDAIEPYLATLLSLRYEEILLEEDQERKRKIYSAVAALVKAIGSRHPALFVFEDVHWIDRFSLELIEHLFQREQIAPSLFLLLFREEFVKAKELVDKGGMLIDLNRLPLDAAIALMATRLEVDEVPVSLRDVIYRRSEGNPFFIEELIKTLFDKDIVSVKKRKMEILNREFENLLPETVQGVIMARIDRLEERLREVLLGASVIGREFSRPILEEIMQKESPMVPSLEELKSLELILEKQEYRELEYLFKHYLIQEVAYNTLLQKRRKKLHGLIARAIEKVYAERLKEFYELLAFHYEKAEEWEKAAEYLSRAGRKVGEMFSKEESNSFADRKEIAIQKLYESASAKRPGWILVGILTAVVLSPIVASMFFMPFYVAYITWKLPPDIEFCLWGSDLLGNIAFYAYVLFLFLVYPWMGLLFTYFGIVPIIKGRPRMFDITEDAIRVVSRKGKSDSIPFSDIKDIWLFGALDKKKRNWERKILDPLGRLPSTTPFSVKIWFTEVVTNILPPFSFGFGASEGEIQIRKKKGLNRRRLLVPWLNTMKWSRVLSISTSNPKEFYDQLVIALAKWKAVHKTIGK
jgi:class 3 adenylate cyclase